MKRHVKFGLAQLNTTVGDIQENVSKIREVITKASLLNLDVVVFPELCLSGYPPEDLLLKPHFVTSCTDAIASIQKELPVDLVVVIGTPRLQDGYLYNAAMVLQQGVAIQVYDKQLLPNYGVFDEMRYFKPGKSPLCFDVQGLVIALNICEDSWYSDSPALTCLTSKRPDVLINLSASPYFQQKIKTRVARFGDAAKQLGCPVVCTNLVGGQDELVFDGGSFVVDHQGELQFHAPQFEEGLFPVLVPLEPSNPAPFMAAEEELFNALVLGTRDYVEKNGFKKVILGLSGGIDSALVAVIATEALGADRVVSLTMPTEYSSEGTFRDAHALAANLGIAIDTLEIQPLFEAYKELLSSSFKGLAEGVAEENIQARIRGNLVMALSNKFGWLVLTTGNKSELAVGYCTLYGDMAGGFAVIKDVPKTTVFALCSWYNRFVGKEVIPESIITRPPSAELRPDQKDEDSLPAYDILDRIIHGYVEQDLSIPQLIDHGLDEATVKRIVRLIDVNEYKRRQAPPGIKITPKAFGRDRRMPITNRYKG